MGADEWTERRECVKHAHENCLNAIANHYGHPAAATSVEVRAAISAAIFAAFDLGVEFTHRKSTIPPPPPHDPPCEALPPLPQQKLPGTLAVPPLALGAGQNSSSGDDQ